LRIKQGLARLWVKKEAQESHHVLSGVQRVQRLWGNEPSHSQVNSHCRSWTPKWTPKFSECDYKGQNPSVQLASPIWTFETQVMIKRKVENQIGNVATVALGLRPRQGVAKVRVKKETRKSHHILLGMQRVWGHEPSHSQVNSHVGSWSPKRTPKSSKRDWRGQNSSPRRVFYIIGKLLKRRCLKWDRIGHLNICNKSYGQKKGRESN
jgi:hypothetical protein